MRPHLRSQAIQLFVILGVRSLCFGQFSCDQAVTLHRYALQEIQSCIEPATKYTELCELLGEHEEEDSEDEPEQAEDLLNYIPNPSAASSVQPWQNFLVQGATSQYADIGEMSYVLNIINGTYNNFTEEVTNEQYYSAWSEPWYDQADANREAAEAVADDALSYAILNFKAANYYFTGFWPNPFGPEGLEKALESVDAFLAGMDSHPHWTYFNFSVPFNNGTSTASLPGYFITTDETQKLPLLIITGGTDFPKEMNVFQFGEPALDRGYAVVVFDGPGQGQVIRNPPFMPFYPRWNEVFSTVLDYVEANFAEYFDAENIVHEGVSLGGWLSGQACSLTSDRVKVCAPNPLVLSVAQSYQSAASDLANIYGGLAYAGQRNASLLPTGYAKAYENGTGITNTLLLTCNASSGAPALIGDVFDASEIFDPELVYLAGGYGGIVSGDKTVLASGVWQGYRAAQQFGPYNVANISIPVIGVRGVEDDLLGGQEELVFSKLSPNVANSSVLLTFEAASGGALHNQVGAPLALNARLFAALANRITFRSS